MKKKLIILVIITGVFLVLIYNEVSISQLDRGLSKLEHYDKLRQLYDQENKSVQPFGFGDRKYGRFDIGKIGLEINNANRLGYNRQMLTFEYPIGSGISYQWCEALIVGGILNGEKRISCGAIGCYQEINENHYEPLPGYDSGITDNGLAMSNKRRSWPNTWPNDVGPVGSWGFPGFHEDGEIAAEAEGIWMAVDNDSDCQQPTPLNIKTYGRAMQWSSLILEDIIVFKYYVTNIGTDTISDCYVGVHSDMDSPYEGNNEWEDDYGKFISIEQDSTLGNFLYVWDGDDKAEGYLEKNIAWQGLKVLETPEDQQGRGLGLTTLYINTYEEILLVPTQAEVHDMLSSGITPIHNANPHPGDWTQTPNTYGPDITSLFASGPFDLAPGQTVVFSFANVFGTDKNELLSNATNLHMLYNYDYHFLNVKLIAPNGREQLSGTTEIKWIVNGTTPDSSGTVYIYWSRDLGKNWRLLAAGQENSGSYYWDTSTVPDGIYYLIRIDIFSNGFGKDRSDAPFTVNNPGNAVPEPTILYPNGGESLSGIQPIRWIAGDADGDSLTIDLKLQTSLNSWEMIVQGEANDGTYKWDTRNFANTFIGKLILVANDGTTIGADTSESDFALFNERTSTIPVEHIKGVGNGTIKVNVVDSTAISGHKYRITFKNTIPNCKTFDIFDITMDQYILKDRSELKGLSETPIFDGLRLWIEDYPVLEFNGKLSGWIVGNCNWLLSAYTIADYRYEYEVRFTATGDTAFYPPNYIVPFEIWNTILETKADFANFTPSPDDTTEEMCNNWTSGDPLTLKEIIDGNTKMTWIITLTQPVDEIPILPSVGDVAKIYTSRPFITEDTFEFNTGISQVRNTDGNRPLTYRLFQNYPNPFNLETTIEYQLPQSTEIDLIIYNLQGCQVRHLVHRTKESGNHTAHWDGRDKAGQLVASGIFFYRFSVKSEGDKGYSYIDCKKMILIK